ncbi:YeiH family protein [Sphingosinicella microcystinivorans]|uniref:Membrane protein n=1 Tax=Sphingosinicella microcystinivorans TaxID=335406 RepID=A0AAD1D619_SPHMI|nr:putative sulfate exporter family transporter [Sphingosinicella microcystinivorans]RKS91086.1 putative integral membrane protein (TIGR00698 family) [Sphingosinicella microcystinivorans]BBE34007.1 membrane protein [Sphingosinicella microcystinivorans]
MASIGSEPAQASTGANPRPRTIFFLSGIALSTSLAVGAIAIASVSSLPGVVVALVLGMITRALLPGLADATEPGIRYCSRSLLRIAVALLGLRLAAPDLAALGPGAIGIVAVSLAATIGTGYLIARPMLRDGQVAAVAAAAVAVCGASAALAVSAIFPQRAALERMTTLVVIVVSLLSTIVMLVYPPLAGALGFSAAETALLFGAAIHDVAQVAGAGLAVSPEVATQAVAVKMIRVAGLLPIVLGFGILLRAKHDGGTRPALLPAFLVAYVALALVAGFGIAPPLLISLGSTAATWLLTAAVAALGLSTRLEDLRAAPPLLLVFLGVQTLLQLMIVVALIRA